MDIRLNLGELKTPADIQKLTSIISEMADSLDTLVSTTAPNGNISGRQGQKCLYNNSGTYTVWINTTGSTVWQQVGAESFVTGDWIISSVATARTGWTDVSATYANKFMRISATPLSTGGADTHSHTIAEANLPSHTHAVGTLAVGNESAHTHNQLLAGSLAYKSDTSSYPGFTNAGNKGNSNLEITGVGSAHTHTLSGSTGAIGSGTAMTADNVPAYISVCIFQKN